MIQPWTDDAKDRAQDAAADQTDELRRLATGDRVAFWNIWMRYRQEFYTHCLRWMGGDREEAEDALSNASLRALKYLPVHAAEIVNLKGWLLRLLYNHCMSTRRTLARRHYIVQEVGDLPEPKSTWRDIGCDSPEEAVSRREMLQGIHHAIGNLPPRLHATVELRLIRDLSYREIATQLNLSPENARKRMQQARPMLQASLSGRSPVVQ